MKMWNSLQTDKTNKLSNNNTFCKYSSITRVGEISYSKENELNAFTPTAFLTTEIS